MDLVLAALKNAIFYAPTLRISHIKVHKVYYETRDLLSSTKSKIYNKEKRKQVKVVLMYKSGTNSNKFLFDPTAMKIVHSRVGEAQVVSMYVQVVSQ